MPGGPEQAITLADDTNSNLPARPRSQRLRLLAMIAVGVLPLVLLAAANLGRQVQEGERRVSDERIALARAAALTVSGFVDTSFATLQTLFRADGWNVALAGSDQPPFTVNVLDREYVQRARSTGMRVVSPATIPRTTGVLTVDLVIPIDFATGGRGEVLGSLALTKLGQQLRALPGSDSSVQIVLVDADGQVILHPDPRVVQAVTSLRTRPEVNAALRGDTGSVRGLAADGTEVLTAFAPVPDYSWGVLVVQPTESAFALVRRDLALALGVLVLTLGLVGAVGWLLGSRLSEAYAQLVGARIRAEDAQRRVAFLAEASRILASPLDDRTMVQRVALLARPTLGDGCAIEVLEDDEASDTTTVEFTSGGTAESIGDLQRTLAAHAIAARRPTLHVDPAGPGSAAALAVPLLAGGTCLGAIICWRSYGRRYGEADIALAEALAERVALAVANMRHYLAAQAAVRARDDFLSVAAHELKTPVTSLRGYAQLAQKRVELGEAAVHRDISKALQVIELQSDKLTRLIGQLLDVSRLETRRLTITRELVDLVPVIGGLIDRTRMTAEHHSFQFDAPQSLVARVDPLRIEQVITNLLDNAVKFSPQGGQVRVELMSPDDGTIRVLVQDQGIGIPPEKRGHIFERFYQAHEERLRSGFAGMGLGLYVSRDIVEQHGGTIEVEAAPAGGTRFIVTLPQDADTKVAA